MLYNPSKNIFGLDIGDHSLKLVVLAKEGKKLILKSFNDLNLADDIIINGEIKKPDELNTAVNQLIRSATGAKVNTSNVVAALPESKTFVKVIDIPATPEEKLNLTISEEVKNYIPLSTEEMYLDWQILNQDQSHTQLLVGAASKDVVNSYYSILTNSGLSPCVLEIEAAAIIRSLINENKEKNRRG